MSFQLSIHNEDPTLLFPKSILLLNTSLAFLAGLTMNLLLLFLISKRTPKEMRSYARIMRIHCVSDIFYDFIQCSTGVHPNPIGGKVYLMLQGFFTNVSMSWNIFIFDLYFWAILFSIALLPIDFIFRYMSVCRNKEMTNKQLFLLVLTAYSVTFIHAFLTSTKFMINGPTPQSINFTKELQKFPGWKHNVPSYSVTEFGTAISLFNNFFVGFLCTASYGLNCYFFIKIRQTLNLNGKQTNNPRALEIQKTVSRILVLQASLPFIVICLPVLLIDYYALIRIDMPHLGVYTSCIYLWLSAVKPTATILIIPRYRSYVKIKFLGLCRGVGPMSSQVSEVTVTRSDTKLPSTNSVVDTSADHHYY